MMIRQLLYVRAGHPATEPIIDDLTIRATAVFRTRTPIEPGYMGHHECICGAESSNRDYWIRIGLAQYRINSLFVHYLARHRTEISPYEMQVIRGLPTPIYRLHPDPSEVA